MELGLEAQHLGKAVEEMGPEASGQEDGKEMRDPGLHLGVVRINEVLRCGWKKTGLSPGGVENAGLN